MGGFRSAVGVSVLERVPLQHQVPQVSEADITYARSLPLSPGVVNVFAAARGGACAHALLFFCFLLFFFAFFGCFFCFFCVCVFFAFFCLCFCSCVKLSQFVLIV